MNRDANPLVSVIVPVYNGENYLDKLVRNILSEENSGIPIEVIFINDGSGDGSADLINQMASSDDRIVALHQPNRGICAARNTGLDAATGSFIMFSDQDDEPVPGGIRALVDAELETEADLVIGGKDMLRTSGGKDSVTSHIEYLYEDEMLSDILKIETLIFNEDGMHRVSHLWNCLYKRELVEAHGLRFDEAYRMGFEDTDFNNRYLLHCASVAFKSELVYRYYRDNSSSTSLRHNPSYLDDITRLNKNKELITSEIERIAQLMADLDIGYACIDATGIPYGYDGEFAFKGTSGSMKWVYKSRLKARPDENVKYNYDLDLILQELLHNRIILNPRYIVCKDHQDTNAGGDSSKLRQDQIDSIENMKRKYERK